jgi:hypothetical protein
MINIKHICRTRRVQPTTKKENSILSYTTQEQNVDKHSAHKSNLDKNEQYDESTLQKILRLSTLQAHMQYDYKSLRDDYYHDFQKEIYSNTSFNYTIQGRSEETTGDAIHKAVSFKTTKNCSKEEYRNFGIKSMKCLWDSFKKSRTKQDKIQFFKRLITIVVIWLLISTVIATTCACECGKHKYKVFLSSDPSIQLVTDAMLKDMIKKACCDTHLRAGSCKHGN